MPVPDLSQRMRSAKILFMDIDGVMNDGGVIFIDDGTPKTWNVKDRLAIKLMKNPAYSDMKIVWVSGRPSSELPDRAEELGVDEVFSDVSDKLEIMNSVLSKYNIDPQDSVYIGDDLVDLACMEKAGLSCCPADAVKEAREIADIVTEAPGGKGSVREIIEKILQSKGVWEKIVADYKKVL